MNLTNKYNPTIIKEMFIALLPAQVFSLITSCISGIINGLLMGNFLPALSLVALGFASPLVNLIGACAGIVSGGSRIVCGRLIGRGKLESIKNTYSQSLIILVSFGVLFSLFSFFFSENISFILGASGESLISTSNYIKGLAFGFVPTLIVPCLIIFLQMANLGSLSLIATLVLVISDLILSLINIFVLNGGVIGMSLASSISQYIAMFVLFYYLSKRKDFVYFDKKAFKLKESLEIVFLGLPGALLGVMCSIRNVAFNSLALKVGGAAAVSALTILSTAMAPFDMVNGGIGNVSTSLSSVFVGENDRTSLKTLFKETIKIGEVLVTFRLLIMLVLGRLIISLFSKDPYIGDITMNLVMWYTGCMFVNIVYLSFISQFQALGRVMKSNVLYTFSNLLFPLAIAFGLYKQIGLTAIWMSFLTADFLSICLIIIVAMIKNKTIKLDLDKIFDYDKTILDGKSLQISIKSMEDVINVSLKIEEFIKENLNETRKARLSGLCVEELAGNIVEHGFSKKKNNKTDSIDIYVSVIDENILLRIKDNSVPFDLRKKFKGSEDDPSKNIGIRMVSKIAKEISYQSSFGMNIVSIEL